MIIRGGLDQHIVLGQPGMRVMSRTVAGAAAGTMTITVQDAETVNAPVAYGLYYDIKGVDNDGNTDLLQIGTLNIGPVVTLAVS